MMVKDSLHENYCQKQTELKNWYCKLTEELQVPIYSSYDIRDSGFKVSNVDANIYPAGFNNICPTDKESAGDLFKSYLISHYGEGIRKIQLVTEEHTGNPYYWDNVQAIKTLLEEAGMKVLVTFPKLLKAIGLEERLWIEIEVVSGTANSAEVKEFAPDLIVSNNDFSDANEAWAKDLMTPINPPRELGWYQRKKSRYFHHYNSLVSEFAQITGLDPFLLNVETEVFENFDMADEASLQMLAGKVDAMIARLAFEYKKRGIDQTPFVFVKNNSGTYGLAVIRVGSGAEVLEWNYKSRKKMKAAKGGRDVEEVIIQEGISSRVQAEGATAEPVIYMVGTELAGGFLRTHAEKSASESLNSPGAVYKKLCVSDLNVSLQGSPLENVYGWSARLGALAIGREAQEMGIKLKDFKVKPCGTSAQSTS